MRKRPCSVCHRWFWPDARVGPRQRTCTKKCRQELRVRQQAAWREAHADYFIARRMSERAAVAEKEARAPPPLRLPRPLSRLPWDLSQSEFGVQGTDFLGVFGRVLLVATQSERRAQPLDTS